MHSEKGPKVNFNFIRPAHESQSGGNHHVKDATLMILSLITLCTTPSTRTSFKLIMERLSVQRSSVDCNYSGEAS